MNNDRFEQIIQKLIDRADSSDALLNVLQDLTERGYSDHSSSLESTVDNFLLEHQIESQFDPEGYSSMEKKQIVLKKVNLLKNLLHVNNVDTEHPHYITIELCLKFIDNGFALTKEILERLNEIYKEYA